MSYTAQLAVLERIAFLVHQARPDWDESLVRVVLHSHAQQVDGSDLAIAALRCARDPDCRTPKAIGWRGRHWDDLATQPPEHTSNLRCRTCGRREPDCYHRGADDDHVFEGVPMARPRPTVRPPRARR